VTSAGSMKARQVDVRFVAATNLDLEEEVAAKRFREDLFFRLNSVTLAIPPLRERLDELEPLVQRLLANVAAQIGQPPPRLSPAALSLMRAYAWPGNIRELRNDLERAVLLGGGTEIGPEHLPLEKMSRPSGRLPPATERAPTPAVVPVATPGPTSMRDIGRQAIVDALARCAGSQVRAAELLGMPRRTFCSKLKEYQIPRPRA
jgi:DNA-binding NtrC family response regulator